MLILNRCKEESIIIDGCIEVKILEARRIGDKGAKQVSLGITAPKNISILRKEIYDAIIRERESCGVGDKRITESSGKL